MSRYNLTVNGDRYLVDTDDHLVKWKSSVSDAVQLGGGFVNVTNAAGFLTTLLITPNSSVTLQQVHAPDPCHEPWTHSLDEEAFTFENF